MIFICRGFRRRIAFALLRAHMQQNGAMPCIANIFQDRHKRLQIMAVHRANVEETHFLENRAACQEGARMADRTRNGAIDFFRQMAGQTTSRLAQRHIAAARHELSQMFRDSAHRWRNRHVIVVQDNEQSTFQFAGIVHRFISKARRHGAIADDCNNFFIATQKIATDRKAKACSNGCRRMACAKRIVIAFSAAGETSKTTALADRRHALTAACENFMRIGLMADIPDQRVARCVKDIMKCNREFDHAEPGAQMTARLCDGFNHAGAHLFGHALELGLGKFSKVGRALNPFEQRCGCLRHDRPPKNGA